MKIKFFIILIIWANTIKAQLGESMTKESFIWIHGDYFIKIEFDEKGKFEFIEDSWNDCTSGFIIYGKGEYEIIEDSIQLFFDLIPTLNSMSKLDSINNKDKIVNIQIEVKDQNGNDMNDLTLSWGKSKKRWGWTAAKFFDKQFDKETRLELRINKKLNYLRVEKDGYYWGIIELPKKLNKDYLVKVTMRPKPQVKSLQYISNTGGKLKIISSCEIQLNDGVILKKENCQ